MCKRLWTLPVHRKEYHIISQIPIHSQKRLQYIFPNPVFCFHLWQVFWHVLYTCQNTQVTKNQALWKKGYISLQPYMLLLIEKTDILATLYFVNIFSSILNNMSRNPLRDPVHEQNGSEPTFQRVEILDLWGTQRGRSISWLLPPKAENILALEKRRVFSQAISFWGHLEAEIQEWVRRKEICHIKHRIFWVPIPILRIGR